MSSDSASAKRSGLVSASYAPALRAPQQVVGDAAPRVGVRVVAAEAVGDRVHDLAPHARVDRRGLGGERRRGEAPRMPRTRRAPARRVGRR
jgi:hypothetical protein